jgi:predicted nicotinamide N-methyase
MNSLSISNKLSDKFLTILSCKGIGGWQLHRSVDFSQFPFTDFWKNLRSLDLNKKHKAEKNNRQIFKRHASLFQSRVGFWMEKVGTEKIPKISDIFSHGVGNLKNSKFQRIANNLKWRQQFQHAEIYELTIGRERINFHQIDNGEMRGIGTGAVVWPAAHVLVKYLEKRYGLHGMTGLRVIDIGSGTGFAGIAAAALGGDVVLTDQLCVKDLILSNIEEYHSCQHDSEEHKGSVTFAEYNWDENAETLNPPFDLVLVSDCVLPKLYPIEPLVKVGVLS